MDLAHSAIQRDLNELKSVINIPKNEKGMTKSIETTSTDHVDPNEQKVMLVITLHKVKVTKIRKEFLII